MRVNSTGNVIHIHNCRMNFQFVREYVPTQKSVTKLQNSINMISHRHLNFLRENQFLNILGELTAPCHVPNAHLQLRLFAKL